MDQLFDVTHIVTAYGYIGIFIIVFLESGIFFALPADSLLFTAGLLAFSLNFNIYYLMGIIFVATFTGAMTGYEIGFHLEKLRKYSFFQKFIKTEHLNKTHDFFDKHGAHTIFISRFVPVVRTFTPIAAGVAHMPYHRFVKYSFVSAFLWSTSIPLLGFLLGQTFPIIKEYLTWVILLIVFVSLIPVMIPIWKKRKQKQSQPL